MRCGLCGRTLVPGPSVDRHHLVPKSHGGQKTVMLHRICHTKIHSVLTEKELADFWFDLRRLRSHPELAAFIKWVRKKEDDYIGKHKIPRRG